MVEVTVVVDAHKAESKRCTEDIGQRSSNSSNGMVVHIRWMRILPVVAFHG
jgi:hypothetical protein